MMLLARGRGGRGRPYHHSRREVIKATPKNDSPVAEDLLRRIAAGARVRSSPSSRMAACPACAAVTQVVDRTGARLRHAALGRALRFPRQRPRRDGFEPRGEPHPSADTQSLERVVRRAAISGIVASGAFGGSFPTNFANFVALKGDLRLAGRRSPSRPVKPKRQCPLPTAYESSSSRPFNPDGAPSTLDCQ